MKQPIQTLALLPILALLTGCNSTGGYFVDRGRDMADIFLITAGTGVGARGRIGPIGTGLYGGKDKIGLRDGYIIHPRNYQAFDMRDTTLPIPFITGNSEGFWFFSVNDRFYCPQDKPERYKDYGAFSFAPLVSWVKTPYREPGRTCAILRYNSQIEIALGLGGCFHLGLNGAELLDFLLGWSCIDFLNDDLEKRNIPNGPESTGALPEADAPDNHP